MKTKKKLMKSHQNRVLTGVLGGIADYFGINARYLRIAYLVLTILFIHTMLPVLIYLALMVLMPSDYGANDRFSGYDHQENNSEMGAKPRGRKILHDVEEKDDHK
ncbi:PspC domain-containing protein [Nicoliella spurrieriana]|uniref:PspC domain-containing protein n=1 Tax=Nicoliella spurrieriana TaxID=2925830 RepID=A0A976RSB3_9LACO|nr:PspC domain-containing protein [Nicoliella spurrieriana]UQS86982.1 PspC domain-containing protein [Nicoliella spurrieriana]